MPPKRRAVIDVGTNSVKLLVAEVTGRTVRPLLEKSEQTRLGEGFYQTHLLQPDALARTTKVIATYSREAAAFEPESIRVVATSAARDAVNQAELLQAVETTCGRKVEVISGEQEALWAFAGVTSDPALVEAPLLIVDVGGGSTEFILGQANARHFQRSIPLGTVRLLEKLRPSDPPSDRDWVSCRAQLGKFFRQELGPGLWPALHSLGPGELRFVGTGGTTTILARIKLGTNSFDRARIEAVRLSRAEVRRQRERLWVLPLAGRKEIVGLPPDRADVILMGVAIFEVLMEEFGFDEVSVSTRGLRFAAVMDP